jgi:hypothetical protein
LFDQINLAFDCMPVAAVISGQLFCCHGGIPHTNTYIGSNVTDTLNLLPRQPTHTRITQENILDALLQWTDEQWRQTRWNGCNPSAASIPPDCSEQLRERFECRQRVLIVAYQVMWSDPYSLSIHEEEPTDGFFTKMMDRSDPHRPHPRVLYFTHKAAENFLERHCFTRILRGHQGKRSGVELSLFYKVLTIFSDSCDHFQSRECSADGRMQSAMTLCGCVLVDSNAIRCIICQPMASLTQ